MENGEVFQRLGLAVGVGLIVGLQRERIGAVLAGIRTFPLITLLGALCGLAGAWAIGGGFVALAAVIVAGAIQQPDEKNPGITTEVSMLVMFGIGVALGTGPLAPPIAAAGAVAVLLHLKQQLHGFAQKLNDQEVKAIMQFVVVSLVILPALPDRYFGPYDVLNPQRLWLTVVLIVGVSLAGFLLYRWLGERAGTLAAGALGGLISSTATTVSFARKSKAQPDAGALAALVIMIASAVVFARVLVIIGVTAPNLLPKAVAPIGCIFILALIISFCLWRQKRETNNVKLAQGNPAEFKAALIFVVLYAVVLLAVAYAKERFGSSGLYIVAVLSGLTDMDAITLSMSQMVQDGGLAAREGWRMILAAGISNLFFKTAIVAAVGTRILLVRVAVAFGMVAAAGFAVLFLWPD